MMTVDRSDEWRASRRRRRDEPISAILARSGVDLLRQRDAVGRRQSLWNDLLHYAGMLGITVCAAAGDDCLADNVTDGSPHVDYPAASPWVLGCGGTRLTVLQAKPVITSTTFAFG